MKFVSTRELRNRPDVIDTINRLRAEAAAAKMRQQAVGSGLDKMTMDEIDEEIRAVRSERASS